MKRDIEKAAIRKRLQQVNRLPPEYRHGTASYQREASPRRSDPQLRAPFKSILVPLDSSSFAEHALPLALSVAAQTGARIHLAYTHMPMESIYDPHRLYFARSFDAFIKREQTKYLSDMAQLIEKAYRVHVTTTLIEAEHVGESLANVGNVAADLVVMATHGRGRLGNWWWNSIANQLTNRATVPHLFVRGSKAPVDLTCIPKLKHVLVPLDGSKAAEKALVPAAALATAGNSDCTLLRVIPAIRALNDISLTTGTRIITPSREYATASHYLSKVAKSMNRAVTTCTAREERSVAASIITQSKNLDVDVIALTSQRRSRLGRLFRPSMAEQLLHKGNVPVLVCP